MARTKIGLALTLALLVNGCSVRTKTLKVGSKNFTEQLILGEMMAQHLEKKMRRSVMRYLNLGGTLIAHQALVSGPIDLYPEYTGTAVSAILKQELLTDPKSVLQNARNEYATQFQCEWMDPLGFDNSFVLVADGETAKRLHVSTLSEAAASGQDWKLGAGYEFQDRKDGSANLFRNYDLKMTTPTKTMDLGLLYQALSQKQVNLVAGSATDGLIESLDARVLTDDKKIFPPYEAAFVVRNAAIADFPGLREAVSELSGKINAATMRRLNYEVDGKKRQPREVASEFLKAMGL